MSKGRKGIRRLTTKMRGKLSIVFLGIFCLFLLLVVRLVYWNVKEGTKFRNIVLGQQNHTSTAIAYERGKIFDRNGNILAANEKVYTLVLEPKNILVKLSENEQQDPKAVEESKKQLNATVEALSKYLGYNQVRLRRRIEDNPESYYEIYREENKEITFDQVEAFKAFREKGKLTYDDKTPKAEVEEIEKARLVSGVMFEESYRRIYPYKSLACRVLGFTSSGNQGNWGIEQQYNSVLNGVNGRSYYYFDEELTQRQTVKDAVDGNSVVSTLDMRIQKIVEKRLRQYDDSIGSKETNILVMDPNTGEVLAMAGSNPYDLNDPMNEEYLKIHYTEAQINEMKAYTKKVEEENAAKARRESGQEIATTEEKEETDQKEAKDAVPDMLPDRTNNNKAEDKTTEATTEAKESDKKKSKTLEKTIYEGFYELWRNSIISDTKEPGSTYKPFTVAAGFETGTLTGNEDYYCDGALSVGRRRIGCSHTHGDITLKQAVAESCNVAMMNIAYKEGADKFYYYQNLFGFGRKTGIDLPGEADTSTLVYNADNYQNDVTLCTNSFGQNFNCSMIQLAAGFASLINGGNYYKPWVVKQIQSNKGDVVEDINKVLVRNTVSEETSRTLRNYLRSTVTSGTGRIAQIPGYAVAGKTGTAEKIPRNKEDYYISFVGFVPAKDPEIMIYVTIDEPHVKNQATAGPAVNLARECLEDILPVLEMEPTEEITQSDLDRYELYTGRTWDPDKRVSKKKKKSKKK